MGTKYNKTHVGIILGVGVWQPNFFLWYRVTGRTNPAASDTSPGGYPTHTSYHSELQIVNICGVLPLHTSS